LLLLDKHFISYNDKMFLYRDEIFLKTLSSLFVQRMHTILTKLLNC